MVAAVRTERDYVILFLVGWLDRQGDNDNQWERVLDLSHHTTDLRVYIKGNNWHLLEVIQRH